MIIIYILLIVIIIAGSSGIFYILKYNQIQYMLTKIEQSEGIIDETLRNRYDLIAKTIKIEKSKIKSIKDYFKDFKELRDKDTSNFDFDRELMEYISLCETVRNDYKELTDNKDLKVLFNELKRNDEKLVATKNYYNRQTTEFNSIIRRFPVNLIAIIHHLKIRPFFDGKDLTDDIVDDFKI